MTPCGSQGPCDCHCGTLHLLHDRNPCLTAGSSPTRYIVSFFLLGVLPPSLQSRASSCVLEDLALSAEVLEGSTGVSGSNGQFPPWDSAPSATVGWPVPRAPLGWLLPPAQLCLLTYGELGGTFVQPVAVGELSAELCCWQVSTAWALLAGAVLSLLLFPLPCSSWVLPPTVPLSGSLHVQTCGCSSCKDST